MTFAGQTKAAANFQSSHEPYIVAAVPKVNASVVMVPTAMAQSSSRLLSARLTKAIPAIFPSAYTNVPAPGRSDWTEATPVESEISAKPPSSAQSAKIMATSPHWAANKTSTSELRVRWQQSPSFCTRGVPSAGDFSIFVPGVLLPFAAVSTRLRTVTETVHAGSVQTT
eukprot:4836271-Prymnesium_polylepis.1